MEKKTINVTEAARNFSDSVSRAYYQNTTFVLLKNGSPVARLVPERGKVCLGRDLAEVLGKCTLPPSEAKAWRRDLRRARRILRAPAKKW